MFSSRMAMLVIALLVGLAGCAPGSSVSSAPSGSGQLTRVTLMLGYRPDVQFAPFYFAQEHGYYRDAGLEVSIENKQSPDVIRLVADGQAQFGVADATDVMISRTSGIPLKYVSTLYDRFPVSLIGRAGTVPSDPAGLRGKRIGTPGRFGSSWAALLAVLKAGGLTVDDVTIREYPQFNQVDGLANGDVDLVTGFRNNDPLRLEARGIRVDQMTIDDIAPLPGPGIVVGDATLASRADVVARFARATARAQAAVIDDPKAGLAAAEAVVPTIRDDEATALSVLRATAQLWQGQTGFGNGRIDPARWQRAFGIMRQIGLIDGSVAVDEMIAPQVLAGA